MSTPKDDLDTLERSDLIGRLRVAEARLAEIRSWFGSLEEAKIRSAVRALEITKALEIPSWTIVYETCPQTPFRGIAYEFFADPTTAYRRYQDLREVGRVPTLRPYFHATDAAYLTR